MIMMMIRFPSETSMRVRHGDDVRRARLLLSHWEDHRERHELRLGAVLLKSGAWTRPRVRARMQGPRQGPVRVLLPRRLRTRQRHEVQAERSINALFVRRHNVISFVPDQAAIHEPRLNREQPQFESCVIVVFYLLPSGKKADVHN